MEAIPKSCVYANTVFCSFSCMYIKDSMCNVHIWFMIAMTLRVMIFFCYLWLLFLDVIFDIQLMIWQITVDCWILIVLWQFLSYNEFILSYSGTIKHHDIDRLGWSLCKQESKDLPLLFYSALAQKRLSKALLLFASLA